MGGRDGGGDKGDILFLFIYFVYRNKMSLVRSFYLG